MSEEKLQYKWGPVNRTMVFDRGEPDKFGIYTELDVEQVLETNKALREEVVPHSTNKLVARVPMTIYEKSLREDWGDDDWKKFLNDSDNAAFRVWPGRV